MEQSELLRFVVDALERIGLRYFVTGSMATIFFGEPSPRARSLVSGYLERRRRLR